jgi:predicted dehydrogenase
MIGAGRVAEVHYQAIKDIPEIELVGIYDTNKLLMARRVKEWSLKGYNSVEELLFDMTVDAVLILTHVDSHIDLAHQSISAGKHVFIEKPVSTDSSQIRELKLFFVI